MRLIRNGKFKLKKWWDRINDIPSPQPNKTHNTVVSIFRIALKSPKSKLILMPIADKRIIKLEKQGLYIKLERFNISITNHKYNYMVEIHYSLYQKLVKMFDTRIDNNYSQEEKQMVNQLEVGIESVLKTLIIKNNG
jgi:hypothetical protein